MSPLQSTAADIGAFVASATKPLLTILGPTASGKTAFSIALAEKLQTELGRQAEIVNADSRQLYRYLDIGTAKITAEEMRGIPHHLIDILDPAEDMTAAQFKTLATTAIEEIHARGNVPLLVGGSMLYISAVVDDLQFPKAADPALRERLEQEYDEDGGKTLHGKLRSLDPETAKTVSLRNKPYVIRALEIALTAGTPASVARIKGKSPYDQLILGIQRPRTDLVWRINERTATLLRSGWVEEVLSLLDKGYGPHDPGMKSHGYREIMREALILRDTGMTNREIVGTLSSDQSLIDDIAANTRQYAKRQMTWWKRDKRIRWIAL